MAFDEDDPPMTDSDSRLRIDVKLDAADRGALVRDVREGLGARPYHLPPKYFYDDVGSRLFDQICDTPEYYLTRAESSLLQRIAADVVRDAGARTVVELGSGAARKTRIVLEAALERFDRVQYAPIDVSASMLEASAKVLLQDHPGLRVHGIVGDYERHLATAPRDGRRMVMFLGSSIGNFAPGDAERFTGALARQSAPGDALLIGFDLVKDVATLERAYDDAAGITAAFNRNVLVVLNRELRGDFDPQLFAHVAFYNRDAAQIEMHLRAERAHTATLAAIDLHVPFERGETIHTEISRKFTRETATVMLEAGGWTVRRWDVSDGEAFALALAVRA